MFTCVFEFLYCNSVFEFTKLAHPWSCSTKLEKRLKIPKFLHCDKKFHRKFPESPLYPAFATKRAPAHAIMSSLLPVITAGNAKRLIINRSRQSV